MYLHVTALVHLLTDKKKKKIEKKGVTYLFSREGVGKRESEIVERQREKESGGGGGGGGEGGGECDGMKALHLNSISCQLLGHGGEGYLNRVHI